MIRILKDEVPIYKFFEFKRKMALFLGLTKKKMRQKVLKNY